MPKNIITSSLVVVKKRTSVPVSKAKVCSQICTWGEGDGGGSKERQRSVGCVRHTWSKFHRVMWISTVPQPFSKINHQYWVGWMDFPHFHIQFFMHLVNLFSSALLFFNSLYPGFQIYSFLNMVKMSWGQVDFYVSTGIFKYRPLKLNWLDVPSSTFPRPIFHAFSQHSRY